MDDIQRYRTKHPRCRYCIYKEVDRTPLAIASAPIIIRCKLKDKFLYTDSSICKYRYKGMLCKWFKVQGNG